MGREVTSSPFNDPLWFAITPVIRAITPEERLKSDVALQEITGEDGVQNDPNIREPRFAVPSDFTAKVISAIATKQLPPETS